MLPKRLKNILSEQTRSKLILEYVLLAVLIAAAGSYIAQASLSRLIARDEGFYTYAAQLFTIGQLPYLDYFYPQMPLFPVFYGWVFKLFQPSWEVARLTSAGFTIATATLLCVHCQRRYNLANALYALLLFTASNLLLAGLVVSKPYAATLFFIFLAYIITVELPENQRCFRSRLFLAGTALAIACSLRLLVAPLALLFFLACYLKSREQRKAVLIYFSLGLAVIGIPLLLCFARDTDTFLFSNLGYHALRSDLSAQQLNEHRWKLVKILLGLEDSGKFAAQQLPVLLWLSLMAAALRFRETSFNWTLYSSLLVLLCIHFLPNPPYVEYFCLLLPFLILANCEFWHKLFQQLCRKSLCFLPILILLSGSTIYIYLHGIKRDWYNYTRSGTGVIGINTPLNARHWNLGNLRLIQAEILAATKADDQVFSFWPGYLVGTKARTLPGLENHFAQLIAPKITAEQRQKFKVSTYAEAIENISADSPTLALVAPLGPRDDLLSHLNQKNWHLLKAFPRLLLYSPATSDPLPPRN